MQNYAIANKLTPFISMQNHYNLGTYALYERLIGLADVFCSVYREEEREMFPTLKVDSNR